MRNILIVLLACIFLSGCATPGELFKGFLGNSTKILEDTRKDAMIKVFDYDYETCYAKIEKRLKDMPKTSIYVKDKEMIAVYYTDPNTTPVGIFFKEIDPTHTQVEISSPGLAAKEWVASNIFSEIVRKATSDAKIFK